jgi:hypothetical protein
VAGATLEWIWRACCKHSLQPVTAQWLSMALDIDNAVARKAISRLRKLGCLRRVSGDGLGVRYEVVLATTLPADARGKHWAAKRQGGLAQPSVNRAIKTAAPGVRRSKRPKRCIAA